MSDEVPPPPEGVDVKPLWAQDPKAKAEETSWGDEEKLKGQVAANRMRFLKSSGILAVILMWFFAIILVSAMVVWLIHYLCPINWHWLNAEQLGRIQTVIFSGTIGAVVSAFAQKQLDS